MRMRLKSHLDERVDKCRRYLLPVDKSEMNAKLAIQNKAYYDLSAVFNNDNPLYMDIGSGKGHFTVLHAKKFSAVNIIGVELITNVIINGLEEIIGEDIPNIMYVNTGVQYLPKYFKQGAVSRIYLNFPTPKQKNTYANSRLTSPRFLEVYKYLLAEDGEIFLKSDDNVFFEYSLEQLGLNGFSVKDVSRDYKSADFDDEILTEHEKMYIADGRKINRLVAYLSK